MPAHSLFELKNIEVVTVDLLDDVGVLNELFVHNLGSEFEIDGLGLEWNLVMRGVLLECLMRLSVLCNHFLILNLLKIETHLVISLCLNNRFEM